MQQVPPTRMVRESAALRDQHDSRSRAEIETRARRVTPRAAALSLVLLALIAYAAVFIDLRYGSSTGATEFGAGIPPMAALVVLLVVTAANPLLPRVGAPALSRRELLAVYAIVSVGAPVVSHGILVWMLSHSTSIRYLARITPLWDTYVLPLMPAWFAPTDPHAIEAFFVGGGPVPWRLWLAPAFGWGSFLLASFLCTLCLMVLVGRQWITNERLTFPIAQVPLETVRDEGVVGRLPGRSAFWLGFAIPVALALTNVVSRFVPAVPTINYSVRFEKPFWQAPPTGPLSALGDFMICLDPWMIAIAFLLPKELSFSCWTFRWFRVGLMMLAITVGDPALTSEGPISTWYMGGGAMLALVGLAGWTGRRHLDRVVRLAVTGTRSVDTPAEVCLYRWALALLAASFGYMAYFCWLAGARPLIGILGPALIVLGYVAWARIRAETGLAFLPPPLTVRDMLAAPLGGAFLRPGDVTALVGVRWSYFPAGGSGTDVLAGNSIEGLKIADAAGLATGPVARAMGAGFLLSLLLGMYLVLTAIHRYGLDHMHIMSFGWLRGHLSYAGQLIYDEALNPAPRNTNGLIAMGIGAATATALGLLRLRFWWWPLHPVGFLAAMCWGMHWYWLPFFIGWLGKTVTLRYGGLRLYRQLMPVATGLIMGDMVGRGLWLGAGVIVGRTS